MTEASPKLMAAELEALRTGLLPVFERFNTQWKTTLEVFQKERAALTEDLSRERVELSKTMQQEREVIMKDLDQMVQSTVDRSWPHIQRLTRTVLIGVILLVLVMFGLPFLVGYLLGKARKPLPQT